MRLYVWDHEQILFSPNLAFPSLWSIKSVHKTLSQNFWGSSPILLANEWFASPGVASVLLFMKSSANSRLWYLHSCPLEVVADVTNSCFRVFLYSCHNVSVVNCWCFPWSTPIRGVLLSTPVVSFLPQEIPNGCTCYASVCAMVWLIFSSSLSFTIARFAPIDTSLVFMLVTRLTNYNAVCTDLKLSADIQCYLLFEYQL